MKFNELEFQNRLKGHSVKDKKYTFLTLQYYKMITQSLIGIEYYYTNLKDDQNIKEIRAELDTIHELVNKSFEKFRNLSDELEKEDIHKHN